MVSKVGTPWTNLSNLWAVQKRVVLFQECDALDGGVAASQAIAAILEGVSWLHRSFVATKMWQKRCGPWEDHM